MGKNFPSKKPYVSNLFSVIFRLKKSLTGANLGYYSLISKKLIEPLIDNFFSYSEYYYRTKNNLGLKNFIALFMDILCIFQVTMIYMQKDIKIFFRLKIVKPVVESIIR